MQRGIIRRFVSQKLRQRARSSSRFVRFEHISVSKPQYVVQNIIQWRILGEAAERNQRRHTGTKGRADMWIDCASCSLRPFGSFPADWRKWTRAAVTITCIQVSLKREQFRAVED
jgi:hypothetical protein